MDCHILCERRDLPERTSVANRSRPPLQGGSLGGLPAQTWSRQGCTQSRAGGHPAAVHGEVTVSLSARSEERLKTLADSKALSKVAG